MCVSESSIIHSSYFYPWDILCTVITLSPMDGPPTPATVGFFSTSPHPALLLDGCYIEMNQWTALRQGEEQGMMSHYIQALLVAGSQMEGTQD